MVRLYDREWSKVDLLRRVGQMDQLAGIRLVEAGEGKGRGCRLLEVWTGSGLRFQVNAERALDLSGCDYKGLPLAWRSPTGDVHPAYYEPHGLGWLRSFPGGLLATCGLDQLGPPCQDEGVDFGLHGRIANTPASQVSHRAFWDGDDYVLEISGEARQAALFNENLVLRRRITTRLGSRAIHIEDEVANDGFEPAPHMLLYHFNLGFPLVSEHSRLRLQASSSQARDADARAGLAEWDRFQPPTPGYREQVFIHQPIPDRDNMATVELVNPQIGLGLRWRYDTAHLPYLFEWKMMGEGAYVLGVEPVNCDGVGGRLSARGSGVLPLLEPGVSRVYRLAVEVIQL